MRLRSDGSVMTPQGNCQRQPHPTKEFVAKCMGAYYPCENNQWQATMETFYS